MKFIVQALLGFATLVIAPATGYAQAPAPTAPSTIDTARLDAARRLVDLFNLDSTFDQMFVQLAPNFAKAVIGTLATEPDTKPVIDALVAANVDNRDRIIAILSQEFLKSIKHQYPELKARAAEEYAATFTTDELNAIVTFYSSGTGAKMLKLMPQLQAKMSMAGQAAGRIAGKEAGARAFERIEREMLPQTNKKST